MTTNIVSQRFVKCHLKLRELNVIKSSREFALACDFLPQSLSEILNRRRDVTLEVVRKAIEVYHFNPIFLFTGKGELFLNTDELENTLAPTTDELDKKTLLKTNKTLIDHVHQTLLDDMKEVKNSLSEQSEILENLRQTVVQALEKT